MPAEQTRCLLVGMAGVTRTMLNGLSATPWYRTAAVVDLHQDALEHAQHSLNLPVSACFTDLQQALAATPADVAIISTPSELHYSQAKAALEAGLDVLVAKPMTVDFEQAVELVELARSKERNLSVGHQMRYLRHPQAVKHFLDSGALGAVEILNFANMKPRHQALNLARLDQPVLYDMSCHHFDTLYSLLPGRTPEWIMCDGYSPSWSAYFGPCMINALIRFDGGLHVQYQAGYSSQADQYELRLEGERGALRCRGIHMSNNTMRYEFAERGAQWQPYALDDGIQVVDPWPAFFERWSAYRAGGPEPHFSGRRNLKVLGLITAAIESISTGRPALVAGNPRLGPAFQSGTP